MATDRPVRDRPGRPALVATVTGRVTAAALTVGMVAIHYHLWSTGYRHVPTIGDLFLLNVVVGALLALGLLVVPARFLGAIAAATALFTAGTLGALILSIHVGLFGFREFAGAPFLDDSYVVESAGIVVAGVLTAVSVHPRRWTLARPTSTRSTSCSTRPVAMRPLTKETHP